MSEPIYTRAGDEGETSLVGGKRVSKSSARVEAYGAIDEANAVIGMLRSSLQVFVDEEAVLDRILDVVQHRLMNCASRLATPSDEVSPDTPAISSEDIAYLEGSIDRLLGGVGEIDSFVLPAGCEQAARAHVARTVVRRAERRIVDLAEHEPVDPLVLAYMNRLSDVLFAAARFANAVYGAGDVYWDPGR